ncbi:MAG: Hsp20/alpha crystallin family protein [Pseudomonadota bacterium]
MVEASHPSSSLWPSLYEPFRTLGTRIADFFAPASEAASDDANYEISLELPGVKQDDIDVSIDGNLLTIKGEKRVKRESKEGSVYFCERQYGAFRRSFRLPSDAQGDKIDATFTDGVLLLKIPKRDETTPDAKKIEVRSA